MLSMGPITIAVDSYGPVTDNAQSIFELSQIEKISGIKKEIQRIFGFTPDFEQGKKYLEANDSAGNTFKATAKPVLIGTAVAGTTTMIFSIILLLKEKGMLKIELTDPFVLFGLIIGGCFIYSFSGGTIQAVTTGAYRAVSFIKKNINLEISTASQENSKKVTEVATVYAQKGMLNIFFSCFFITLASVFIDPNFFVSFTIGLTIVGLLQAIYMANAGGAWDNAKKVVEVDLQEKGTELHDATIVGDTVGDPYKDTSSVSINPILKFSSLFGLLGIEIAISLSKESRYTAIHHVLAVIFGVLALYFIWRSFYKMRIPVNKETETEDKTKLELIPISSSPNPAE
jgi:K(+)-stimulated pyrophosphate-energized sodium pump